MQKKSIFLAALLISAVSLAGASTGVTCRNGAGCLNGTDHFDWAQNYGPEYSTVANGSTATTVGGLQATVVFAGGGDGERLNQDSGWSGNFNPGDALVWTNSPGQGPLTFNFAAPVSGAGAQIETDYFGAFTAQICDQRGNCFVENGDGEPTNDNTAIFIGLADDPGITALTFTILDAQGDPADFAINQLDVTTGAPVPEPTSLLLLGTGLLSAAGKLRRKLGR